MQDMLITDAASEPVSAATLRADLRDVADSDETLEGLIKEARQFFEEETGLAVLEQARRLTLDRWPIEGGSGDGLGWWEGVREGSILQNAPAYLELPRAPLASISEVRLFDSANASRVWAASNYFADTGRRPGRLALSEGAVFPIPGRASAGIEIDYVAGYDDAANVPAHWLRAIRQIAAHWYENREILDFDGGKKIPLQADRIIRTCRIRRL